MPSLKDLKNRIGSVKSTQKITKAMQMVAAAKLRKAQDAAERSRPYSDRIGAVMANLSAGMQNSPSAPELLIGNGKDDVHLVIVATADRGLCGGFNTNIARKAREHIVSLEKQGKTVKLFVIGKKGHEQLDRLYGSKIVEYISLRDEKTITSDIAASIGGRVVEMFEAGDFDIATLIYSKFESVLIQRPTAKTLIPAIASVETTDEDAGGPDLGNSIYEYEPDEEGILRALLPRNLNTQIFAALLENAAGEMGSKMTAMDNATRNAGDMIDALTLTYNRSRQAQITKELIEIISGAEAL